MVVPRLHKKDIAIFLKKISQIPNLLLQRRRLLGSLALRQQEVAKHMGH